MRTDTHKTEEKKCLIMLKNKIQSFFLLLAEKKNKYLYVYVEKGCQFHAHFGSGFEVHLFRSKDRFSLICL